MNPGSSEERGGWGQGGRKAPLFPGTAAEPQPSKPGSFSLPRGGPTLESASSCSHWLTVRNLSIKCGQKAVIFPLEIAPLCRDFACLFVYLNSCRG